MQDGGQKPLYNPLTVQRRPNLARVRLDSTTTSATLFRLVEIHKLQSLLHAAILLYADSANGPESLVQFSC